MAVPCEQGNEASGSIKGGKFVGNMCDYQFIKNDSAP
jgi:hypothetical protein